MSDLLQVVSRTLVSAVLLGGPALWLGWVLGHASGYRVGRKDANAAWRRSLDARLVMTVPIEADCTAGEARDGS